MSRPVGEDCLSKGLRWAGGCAAVSLPVGFLTVHEAMKKLTLEEKRLPLRNSVRALGIMANPMATFAAAGFAFAAGDCATRNYLGRDDTLTGVVGGLLVGVVFGLKHSSLPAALGYGGLFAGGMLVSDLVDRVLRPQFGDLKVTGTTE